MQKSTYRRKNKGKENLTDLSNAWLQSWNISDIWARVGKCNRSRTLSTFSTNAQILLTFQDNKHAFNMYFIYPATKKNTWALQMSYLRLILLHICSWNQSAIVLMKQKSWRHTTFEYNNKPMKLLLLKSWLVTPTCLYFSPTNINIWGVSCSKKSHGEVNVCMCPCKLCGFIA